MSYNTRRAANFGAMGGRGRPGMQPNYNAQPHHFHQEKSPMRAPRPPNSQFSPMRLPHNQLPPPPLKSALKKETKVFPPVVTPQQKQQNTIAKHNTTVPPPPEQNQQQLQPKVEQQQINIEQQQPQIPQNVPENNVQQPQPKQQQIQQQELQQQKQQLQEQEQLQKQQEQKLLEQLIVTELPAPAPSAPVPEQKEQQIPISQNIAMKDEPMDSEIKDKRKNLFTKGSKVSKKEKRGRRNRRLRKLLVPKNALMVLHELVGSHKFNFLDSDPKNFYKDPSTYIASVTVDGNDYVGYGKSKVTAKTAAAETALKHIILSKINTVPVGIPPSSSTSSVDGDGDTNMEVEEKQDEDEVSWVHVASFAMHKLFASWYGDVEEHMDQGLPASGSSPDGNSVKLLDNRPTLIPHKPRKPAKQLPSNPEMLNPVMVLNQMRDDIQFEDYSKIGSTPNIIFIIKTTVDGVHFYGKGSNKKEARKNCAYAACTKIYGIKYPPEEYDTINSSIGVPIN